MRIDKEDDMKSTALLLSASLVVGAYLAAVEIRPAFAQSAPNSAPDNSAQNERDRDHTTLTPMDQSNKPEDLKLSREIRQAVEKDDRLSTMAKNIKIITIDGAVTLRGPVKTDAERADIVAKAAQIAGSANVRNELEVARQ
jgi:hyperosmotically inducible periplasmic protein